MNRNGILCIDKPTGLTSHDVVSRVRLLTDTRKVGHGGTLDPLASGLLVLGIGRATRLLEYILGQPKEYQALVRLGQTSSTYDGEGEIVDSGPVDVSESDLFAMLARFRGQIRQVPPMYSALKRKGKPLYELARQGVAVEREAREVTIYELETLSYEPPDVTLHIKCSGGTYIRSLAHDLGQALNSGAYLAGLRRTAVGLFQLNEAAPLQTLTADILLKHLQAMDSAVIHLPRLEVPGADAVRLANGQRIGRKADEPAEELVRVYDDENRFVGIARQEGDRWRPQKIFYDADGAGGSS